MTNAFQVFTQIQKKKNNSINHKQHIIMFRSFYGLIGLTCLVKHRNRGRLAPVLKTIFHKCQNRAIRVRLATSICYDTLMKNCIQDWSQSTFEPIQDKPIKINCPSSEDSNQPGYQHIQSD